MDILAPNPRITYVNVDVTLKVLMLGRGAIKFYIMRPKIQYCSRVIMKSLQTKNVLLVNTSSTWAAILTSVKKLETNDKLMV